MRKKLISLFTAAALSAACAAALPAAAAEEDRTETVKLFEDNAATSVADGITWSGTVQNNGRPQLRLRASGTMSFDADLTDVTEITISADHNNFCSLTLFIDNAQIGNTQENSVRNSIGNINRVFTLSGYEGNHKISVMIEGESNIWFNGVQIGDNYYLPYANTTDANYHDDANGEVTYTGNGLTASPHSNDKQTYFGIDSSVAPSASLEFEADVTGLKQIIVDSAADSSQVFTAYIGENNIGSYTAETGSDFADSDYTINVIPNTTGEQMIRLDIASQETYINSVTLVYSDSGDELTATVENIGAETGDDDDTTATGFITTVSGTGSFDTIKWDVTSNNTEKSFTSKGLTKVTLENGNCYIGMIVNGLNDNSATATATVSLSETGAGTEE